VQNQGYKANLQNWSNKHYSWQ